MKDFILTKVAGVKPVTLLKSKLHHKYFSRTMPRDVVVITTAHIQQSLKSGSVLVQSCLLRVGDSRRWESLTMFLAGNKAKRLSSINYTTKAIHHHRLLLIIFVLSKYMYFNLILLGYYFVQDLMILIMCGHKVLTHFSFPCFDEFFKNFKTLCGLYINRKRV